MQILFDQLLFCNFQELSDNEEQYNSTFRSQLELMDRLDSIHGKRVVDLLLRHEIRARVTHDANARETAENAEEAEAKIEYLGGWRRH